MPCGRDARAVGLLQYFVDQASFLSRSAVRLRRRDFLLFRALHKMGGTAFGEMTEYTLNCR